MADQQTFEITAPNGKTLEVSGDHVPNESELQEIFLKAGVATKDEPFAPTNVKEFLGRMGKAALDMPIGAAKNLGRAVQMIPGVAAGTDKLYGLPAGESAKAMQPSNANQEAGGILGDVALAAATAGAEAGPAIAGKAIGYVSNPTVAQRASAAIEPAANFASETVSAIQKSLTAGPVTPEKVAGLIVKYGKEAVKGAVVAGGGYGAWQAVRHLF